MSNQQLRHTVLLIEDDPYTQQLVRRALGNHGCDVLVASRWRLALTMAQEGHPDLVILNPELPGIGGHALVANLRQGAETKNVPIIVLTYEQMLPTPDAEQTTPVDLSYQSQVRSALPASCDGTLTKPLDPAALPDQIDAFLSRSGRPAQELGRQAELEALLKAVLAHLETQTLELEESRRRLYQVNQQRDNFWLAVSGELRTPLTLITGYLSLLRNTVAKFGLQDAPLSLSEMIEGLTHGADRLRNTVNEIRSISRIVSGDVDLSVGPTSLSSLVSAVLNEIDAGERALANQHELEQLPLIQADGGQLRLVIRNIIIHILDTAQHWQRVRIGGERQQNIVILAFRTSPAGRAAALDPSRSFVDRGGDSVGGSHQPSSPGFGLAVAKGIIQAHGGRIWVEAPSHDSLAGSTFYLLLPIRPVDQPAGSGT